MNDAASFTDVEYFEKTVLAKALQFPESKKKLRLSPEHFADERHGAIASRLLNDITFDKQQLISESVKSPDVYGDYEFVKQIAFLDIVNANGFLFDQEQVLEHYKRREISKVMNDYNNDPNIENRVAIRHRIDQLESIDLVQRDKKLEVISEIFESFHGTKKSKIIKTGLRNLDSLITGFETGQFNVIAGRPSMGKTALALQMALNIASDDTIVLFFSMETREINLTRRILSNMTGVHLEKFKEPEKYMTNEDIDKATAGLELYYNTNIKIIEDAQVTPNRVRSEINNLPDDKNVVVFIDYLQLMGTDSNRRHDNENIRVGEISRELKKITQDIDVTINALSQLSRSVEARQDKRPLMSDLRESGQIEQDAFLIALCYREDYYLRKEAGEDADRSPTKNDELEIIIAKNKDGKTGTALTQYYMTTQKIYGG